MTRNSGDRSGFWVSLALISGMIGLVWVNHTLLGHQAEIRLAVSGGDTTIPSRAEILRGDVARTMIGVVLIPTLGLWLGWAAIKRRPLGTWEARTLMAFVVGLVSLTFHLRWIYDWTSERYLELPSWVVRTLTLLSLNAPLYLSVVGAFVLLRRFWLLGEMQDRSYAVAPRVKRGAAR